MFDPRPASRTSSSTSLQYQVTGLHLRLSTTGFSVPDLLHLSQLPLCLRVRAPAGSSSPALGQSHHRSHLCVTEVLLSRSFLPAGDPCPSVPYTLCTTTRGVVRSAAREATLGISASVSTRDSYILFHSILFFLFYSFLFYYIYFFSILIRFYSIQNLNFGGWLHFFLFHSIALSIVYTILFFLF